MTFPIKKTVKNDWKHISGNIEYFVKLGCRTYVEIGRTIEERTIKRSNSKQIDLKEV